MEAEKSAWSRMWLLVCLSMSIVRAAGPLDLMWSSRPLSDTSIRSQKAWEDVQGTNLTLQLEGEAEVLFSYYMMVQSTGTAQTSGSDFLNSGVSTTGGLSDFLQLRLVVNGIPYRQSSSHVSPGLALGYSQELLSGHAVISLGSGSHDVQLQWKKVGTQVTSWSSRPSLADGHISSRSITATARHKFLRHTHSDVFTLITQEGSWHNVSGMALTFTLEEPTSLSFLYSMTVRSDHVDHEPGENPPSPSLPRPSFLFCSARPRLLFLRTSTVFVKTV